MDGEGLESPSVEPDPLRMLEPGQESAATLWVGATHPLKPGKEDLAATLMLAFLEAEQTTWGFEGASSGGAEAQWPTGTQEELPDLPPSLPGASIETPRPLIAKVAAETR